MEVMPAQVAGTKRKADIHEAHNERLSKRLSRLNLEKNGTKMYVTVENPTSRPSAPSPTPVLAPIPLHPPASIPNHITTPAPADSMMQLDDDKYKVYIYNIDDELSSDDESVDSSKLVFLPDIEKHLRATRIPAIPLPILPNADGELAGKQLVLYSVPSSLSVPEERDSVRKAIIEARARSRAQSAMEHAAANTSVPVPVPALMGDAVPAFATPSPPQVSGGPYVFPSDVGSAGGFGGAPIPISGDDPDAMDID